jgi:hypothetical protein
VKRLLIIGALALAGCPASHGGYPTRDCKAAADCFAGEACVDRMCVPAGDGGAADLAPAPDLAGDGP